MTKLGDKQTRLVDQPWVQKLLARESFTGKEAGELSGKYSGDALTQLRTGAGLVLEPLGSLEGGHPHAKRFRLRRTEEA